MEPPRDWHSSRDDPPTLRLPEGFDGVSQWARTNGVHDVLEVVFLCLGRFPDSRIVKNFSEEVARPKFNQIWAEWSDHPVAQRLWKFADALESVDSPVQGVKSVYLHKGRAKRTKQQFPNLTQRTFLLAMISNPLSGTGSELQLERQRLRMWLVVQAAIHATNKKDPCISDKYISEVSRQLTIGSTDDKEWQAIDALLRRAVRLRGDLPVTFQRFSDSVGGAARLLRRETKNKKQRVPSFLNAVIAIAEGGCEAFPEVEGQPKPNVGEYPCFKVGEPPSWSFEGGEDFEFLVADTDGNDDDAEETDTCLVSVDPTDSDSEQVLTSRAVFLHEAETSHYLPWSWDKLLPPELQQVEGWIAQSLGSGDRVLALGAALAWVASRIGRSLFHLQRLEITDARTEEWSISSEFARIKRKSPRRPNSWHPETPQEVAEVCAFRDELVFELPGEVTAVFKRVATGLSGPARRLADLWRAVSPDTKFTKWFDDLAKDRFPRVTSGKFEQIGGQRIFDQTGDPNLARLATAPPNSGLPGACGYASWDVSAIAKGIALSPGPLSEEALAAKVLGSLLVPLESVLTDGIALATTAVTQSAEADLVTFHNRYASYCVAALNAGTGCRHLKSPFESLSHFNWAYRCAFINDKTDGGLHDGRMVPLPEKLIALTRHYAGYLKQLANATRALRPALAEKLDRLVDGQKAGMPLFFLLDEQLQWHTMTDPELPGLPLLHWSLPANLFRHRYSQQLSCAGVPVDVVDGWMGHAERAVATYGDFSPRCWFDDARQYEPAINRLYDMLGFAVIAAPETLPPYRALPRAAAGQYSEPVKFGLRQRQEERRRRWHQAKQQAQLDIEVFLGDRELDALTEDELNTLGNRMLRKENGFSHSYAGVRFQVLVDYVRAAGSKHVRSIRKRLARQDTERSLVRSQLPEALDKLKAITAWADATRKTVLKVRPGRADALCLGAVLLCIEKKLSYRRLLVDVAEGRNYRLVQHKKSYYLEYSEEWDPADFSAPVQRHEISYATASLLHYGKGGKRSANTTTTPCPSTLLSLLQTLLGEDVPSRAVTISQMLKSLSSTIAQTNLVLLPGMVAAALSERLPPTSLPWHDYLRLLGEGPVLPPEMTKALSQNPGWAGMRLNQGLIPEKDKLHRQDNAERLYKDIDHLIAGYEKPRARDSATAIEKVCRRYNGQVSSGVLMLGYWIAQVIRKGKGKGKGKIFSPYAKGSIERYFDELKTTFREQVYEKDLMAMDSDEITDLYNDMIKARRGKDLGIGYFSQRLKVFQRWAGTVGVENPDWGELDTEDNTRSVNPGCLSEADYLACQLQIRAQWGEHSSEALFLGFVLLLAYRFGLRANEAIGLRRRDWCEHEGFTWVLVRNNRERELKSYSGRRAVPLLFTLHELEKTLIDKVLNRYETLPDNSKNYPLLSEIRQGRVQLAAIAGNIARTLVHTLKTVTGSPTLVLHHCRHTFYNRLAPSLFGIDTPLAKALCDGMDPETVRRVVLGEQHAISRRVGMAMARLMGHYRPTPGLKNYNHLMTEWADALTPVKHVRARTIEGMTNTRDFERVAVESSIESPVSMELPGPTLLRILSMLHLVARGKTFRRAGEMVLLDPDLTVTLEGVFTQANDRMRFKQRGEKTDWLPGKDYPCALLQYVSEAAWIRLLEKASTIGDEIGNDQPVALPPLFELPSMAGMNRHILMSHERHCHLLKKVLELFEVPESSYHVVAARNNPVLTSLLQDQGFEVVPLETISTGKTVVQLDSFVLPVESRQDRRLEYGGLIMKRNGEGVVRTSFELVVVLLATGALLISSAEPQSQVA